MSEKIKYGECELCCRELKLTWHHLIPQKMHNKKRFLKLFTKEDMKTRGANLCFDCHPTIHKFFDEKFLGLYLNTIEKLKGNEKIINYLSWVVKQDKKKKRR